MKPVRTERIQDIGLGMDRLWKRRDLLLLAPGSLPCVRELYHRARAAGALPRFRYVRLAAEDYILGSAEEAVRCAVREAARTSDAAVIVIYLSCLDILIRLDFEDIERSLSAETGRTVRCFFRGPLAKTDAARHPCVEEILRSLPPEGRAMESEYCELPPPMPDAAGISDFLRVPGMANVLLTPAGCRSAMRDGDMAETQENVYYSEPGRMDYVFGWEETAAGDAADFLAAGGADGLAMIGSAVPAFLGFDECVAAERVSSLGKKFLYFPSDGFHDAAVGAAEAELLLVKRAASCSAEAPSIWVLGAGELTGGGKEGLSPYISFFETRGLSVCFPGEGQAAGVPKLAWAVSSAGLAAARWLFRQFSVPILAAAPAGSYGRALWEKNAERLLAEGGSYGLRAGEGEIRPRYEDAGLFIGDPVAVMGAACAFMHEGFCNLTLSSYAWTRETERLYRMAPGAEKIAWFHSREGLAALWEAADFVVCDPELLPIMGKKPCVPLPWGYISGRRARGGVMGRAFAEAAERFMRGG